MKIFFRILLFFFFLLLISGVAYSWVNIWVPKNHIGILYVGDKDGFQTDENTKIKVISTLWDRSFALDWQWRRILPKKTHLLLIDTNSLVINQEVDFYLPSADFIASTLNRSPELFRTQLFVSLSYTLTEKNLTDYISNNFTLSTKDELEKINNTRITKKLSATVSRAIFDATQKITFDSIKNNNIDLKNSISQQITSKIQTNIQNLPIIIEAIEFQFRKIPDFAAYKYINEITSSGTLQNADASLSNSSIENSSSNRAKWLQQYLYLIKELATISQNNPQVIEIIKALPPSEIIANPNSSNQ